MLVHRTALVAADLHVIAHGYALQNGELCSSNPCSPCSCSSRSARVVVWLTSSEWQLSTTESAEAEPRVRELSSSLRGRSRSDNQGRPEVASALKELDGMQGTRVQVAGPDLVEPKTKVRRGGRSGVRGGNVRRNCGNMKKSKAFSAERVVCISVSQKLRWLFNKMNRLQVGYQYQLQINGIPCSTPTWSSSNNINQECGSEPRGHQAMTKLALEDSLLRSQSKQAQA